MPDHTSQQPVLAQTFEMLAQQALASYPKQHQGSLKLISISENATYCITNRDGKCFALRIHRLDYHERDEIESELAWLAALHDAGIEVPIALPGADGEYIQCSQVENIRCWVVMFAWIEGSEPHTMQNLNASFKRLGRVNASLHMHVRSWSLPQNFQRMVWDHHTMLGEHGHWGQWQHAPHLDHDKNEVIGQTVKQINEQLIGYGKAPSRFGLIHADLRLANLLIDGEQTHIIDFDDCGFSWYLHDLASALSFYEHHAHVDEWIRHWLSGYTELISLSQTELDILPTLVMQRRLQLLAWSGSHADTVLAKSLGPVWVEQTEVLCRRYLDGRGAGKVD